MLARHGTKNYDCPTCPWSYAEPISGLPLQCGCTPPVLEITRELLKKIGLPLDVVKIIVSHYCSIYVSMVPNIPSCQVWSLWHDTQLSTEIGLVQSLEEYEDQEMLDKEIEWNAADVWQLKKMNPDWDASQYDSDGNRLSKCDYCGRLKSFLIAGVECTACYDEH